MKSVLIENLFVRYGQLDAVRDLSLSVEPGELFGLLGPNGAGKSTTLSVLTANKTFHAGNASVLGHDLKSSNIQARLGIGVVFQECTLDRQLSPLQNLRLHGFSYGMRRDAVNVQSVRFLKMFDLWERRNDSVHTFSGGMRRRLEIARALLHEPRLLLLDEPMSGLDPQTRLHIWDHLDALRRRETLTIMMTTHDMSEAERSTRIAVVDKGRVIASGTPNELKASIGHDHVQAAADDVTHLRTHLRTRYNIESTAELRVVSFFVQDAKTFLADFVTHYDGRLESVRFQEPTLDDVFIQLTGRKIRSEQ